MRPAVVQNWEAEATALDSGIHLAVTPAQLVWLQQITIAHARSLERLIEKQRDPVQIRILLSGLKELIELMGVLK